MKLFKWLCCCCTSSSDEKKMTESQKRLNLKTLEEIKMGSQTEKSKLWSKTKSPLEVKTIDMTDMYTIPGQFKEESELLQSLGYINEGFIERGSYGMVFEGKHISKGLKVAIKQILIPIAINEKMQKERNALIIDIKNELYILQKLIHPHVIRLIQHFMTTTEDNKMTLYIIMQFASGGTLSQKCEKKGPFNESQCQIWFSQILNGLVYMHSMGIAHRDLKQSNILLDDTDDCLISDFGLSRLVWRKSEAKLLLSQTYCGTPPYIAPEVLALKVDSYGYYNAMAADVWALGVILFKMFDNNYPFSRRASKALKDMHRKKWRFINSRPSNQLKDLFEQIFEPNVSKRPVIKSLTTHKWIKNVYIITENKIQTKLKTHSNQI